MSSLPTCSDSILQQIERHAMSDTAREVGGILVGVVNNGLVEIRAALPALKATAEATHVTFTHEVWDEILTQVDRDHPECRIVGWYHSHPGFGIFLSEYDKFIQANFFSDERMLALVVDPKAGQSGWFGWDEGVVQLFKTFPTLTAPARVATAAAEAGSPSGGQRRNRSGNAILAGALAGVVGLGLGYGVAAAASSSPKSTVSPSSHDPADTALAAARLENDRLGRELALAKAGPNPVATGSAPTVFVHRLRADESFWSLAEFVYGHGSQYSEIQRDNPTLDPNHLPVGTDIVIRLPADPGRANPAPNGTP